MLPVKKAVLPVAGLGTRFLPATKASPKEMMPVVDKPLVQYAVEEAISAGIRELIFVTSGAKRAIEDHFDRNRELEDVLREKQQWDLLRKVESILPKGVMCVYIRQQEALGLGHAVLCAKDLIKDEPFAVLLADDLIVGDSPCLAQMLMHIKDYEGVLAVQEVPRVETKQYGIVSVVNHRITGMVEKPDPQHAPSNLAVVGRYILPPEIFVALEGIQKGSGGEIQLTDAIASLLPQHALLAYHFSGTRYDCGDKVGYLKANLELGLRHPECGPAWTEYLRARFAKV